MLGVGNQIPDVEVEAFHENEMKKIRLSGYRGKWVILLFYPADFTFICPTELEEAAENYDALRKLGVEVLSASTDTVYSHKAWHDTSPSIKKVKYPMLSDPTGNLCRAFGTYIEKEGLSLRATFIIDPKGVVKSVEMHDNSIGRNIKETIRKLQAAKFVSEHEGMVCPASWEPGKKTLKPGVGLVGKI
jgi:peroxiredoxin (alkyl hydroperoxide reductase subunit C)